MSPEDEALLSDQAPDREWRVICHYVDESQLPGRGEELALYRKGYQFLRRMKRHPTSSEHVQIRREHPILYGAYALYHDLASCRWIIEAGIVADVSCVELGAYTGIDPAVISMYERLFFNIRDKLACTGYIQNLISPSLRRGVDSKDYDFLYKIIARAGGWSVLKEYLEAGELTSGTERWLTRSCLTQIRKLSWTAAHRVEVNQFNSLEILEQFLNLYRTDLGNRSPVEGEKVAELMKSLIGGGCLSIMTKRELQADEARAMAPVLPYTGTFSEKAVKAEVEDGAGKAE